MHYILVFENSQLLRIITEKVYKNERGCFLFMVMPSTNCKILKILNFRMFKGGMKKQLVLENHTFLAEVVSIAEYRETF